MDLDLEAAAFSAVLGICEGKGMLNDALPRIFQYLRPCVLLNDLKLGPRLYMPVFCYQREDVWFGKWRAGGKVNVHAHSNHFLILYTSRFTSEARIFLPPRTCFRFQQ